MLDVVKKLFGTEDLYQVLQTTSEEAKDPKKLRMCYLRAALSYHPDKARDDEKATQKFQLLSSIYELLKDEDSKKTYDQTGEWPSDEKFDLEAAVFARIDDEAIDKFKQEYQGSDIEKEDIKKFYVEGKGSYIHIFEHVFFANVIDDEERIRNIVENLIETGELERIPEAKGYAQKWKKYLVKMKKEAKEAEELLKAFRAKENRKSRGNDAASSEDSLTALILKRRESEGTSFLAKLEAKYCGQEPQKKKRKK